ncbi:MAG: hypothetical protein Q9166_002545 [cf. Caloplaca sp. 2 TL-2023]
MSSETRQTETGSVYYTDPGDPLPDILEALYDLFLIRPDTLPAGTPSSKLGITLNTDHSRHYLVPRPTASFSAALHKIITFGTSLVFIKVHTSPAVIPDNSSGDFSTITYEEQVYIQLQRFVVVKSNVKEHYSLCLPITTYGGRGVAKKGVDAALHAIIHTSAHPPALLENEPCMTNQPIKVVAKSPEEKLAPASRLNLGKTHTVEWDTKVKEVGRVDKDSLLTLLYSWKMAMES